MYLIKLQQVAKILETLYLVLMIPPPPLIKLVSNTRPCSNLSGTTLNGREGGGE